MAGFAGSSARSVASTAGSPLVRCVHVAPPSADLNTPTGPVAPGCPFAATSVGNPPARATEAYSVCVFVGSIRMREKHRPAKVSAASTVHVSPPSVDL